MNESLTSLEAAKYQGYQRTLVQNICINHFQVIIKSKPKDITQDNQVTDISFYDFSYNVENSGIRVTGVGRIIVSLAPKLLNSILNKA